MRDSPYGFIEIYEYISHVFAIWSAQTFPLKKLELLQYI